MRLVIDINVLISGLLSGASLPAHLLVLWREGWFDLPTSADQFDELMRVTRYPKIRERLAPALVGRKIITVRDFLLLHRRMPPRDAAMTRLETRSGHRRKPPQNP